MKCVSSYGRALTPQPYYPIMIIKTEEQRQYAALQREIMLRVMHENKLTMNKWAKTAGVSEGTLRHFLSGENESLSERTVNLLAKAINVPSHRLRPGGVAKNSQLREFIDEDVSKLAEEATEALLTMREHSIEGCIRIYKQAYNIGVGMASDGVEPSGGKIVVQWERYYGSKQVEGSNN